jgi:FlaG/FlaF family flagellin (archaellin)
MTDSSLGTDDAALSPVVGIVLMLAITILLGATAATFLVGLSDENISNGPPTAKFAFEYDGSDNGSDSLTVQHVSGDNVAAEHASIVIEDAECVGGADDPDGRYGLADEFELPGPEMKASHTVQIRPDTDFDGTRELCTDGGDLTFSETTVRVVWDTDTTASTTIYSWLGP